MNSDEMCVTEITLSLPFNCPQWGGGGKLGHKTLRGIDCTHLLPREEIDADEGDRQEDVKWKMSYLPMERVVSSSSPRVVYKNIIKFDIDLLIKYFLMNFIRRLSSA